MTGDHAALQPSEKSAAPPIAAGGTVTEADIDGRLRALAANKQWWAQAPISERIAVLREIRGRVLDNALPWARAVAAVRQSPEATAATEMVALVSVVVSVLDGLAASLVAKQRTGEFLHPPSREQNGQTVVETFPWSWKDRYLSPMGALGVKVEMRLKPGKPASQGAFYLTPAAQRRGEVAAVLGAGNQHFLALCDALHLAFVDGAAVLLKYHPLQASIQPFIDYLLEPLAQRGVFTGVTCGVPTTQHLVQSPLVDRVHLTGGNATHDAIVWGPDPTQQARHKAAGQPVLTKPITSELGCVTPWIVTPGEWTEAELTHHARALAEAIGNNCSANCLAAKVVILAEGWPQGDAYLAALRECLASYPPPAPYYPGTSQRYQAFRDKYPQAEAIRLGPLDPELEARTAQRLPFLLNVLSSYPGDPQKEYAFQVEPFAPVLTVVRIPGASGAAGAGALGEEEEAVPRFLEAAVRAANEDLWGTLSCTLLVDPRTQEKHNAAVERALDGLRYGSVCLNTWSVFGYAAMQGSWGAFAGDQTLADVGSGLGHVHNTYLYDHPQKTVVRTPFVSPLHPLPPQLSAMPLLVAKILVGLIHSGIFGVLKMLRAA